MDRIRNFDEFQRLNEFTEFNLQRMNPDRGGMMPNVDDPQLSVNAWDKHQNAIQAATSKLNSILGTLSNSAGFAALKSKVLLDSQRLTSLKILRIAKADDLRYDVYLEFSLGDAFYHGVVRDMLGMDPKFQSEAFRDTELVLTREWVIKTKGLVIKVLRKWMTPDGGIYESQADSVPSVNMKTGTLSYITKGTKIEVLTCMDNQIMVKHEGDFYLLQNDSFIYFNYWFVKVA